VKRIDVLPEGDGRIFGMKDLECAIEMSIASRRRKRDSRHLHAAKVIEQSSADRVSH
jgi:hypothetical protein